MVTGTPGLLWTIKKQYNKKPKRHKTHNAHISMTVTFSPCKLLLGARKRERSLFLKNILLGA